MDEESVRIEIAAAEPDHSPGDETADALLTRWAELCPEAAAVVCPPNRAAFGLGPARSVSFSEADALTDGIARRLTAHGIAPGDIIALQLPNIWEAVVLIAAAWRARLTPVPMPMSWRLGELHHALAQINPAAVVTLGSFTGHDHAGMVREVAAHHLSVRYIFGLGHDLGDGVTPICDWFMRAPPHEESLEAPIARGKSRDTAVMTWGASPSGPFPVPRTHQELLALARVVARELQLTRHDVVLTPYPLTGIAALVGVFVAGLVSGATTVLHQPFDYDTFLAQLRDQRATYTVLPAPVIAELHARGDLDRAGTLLARIGCLWPTPHAEASAHAQDGITLPVFDIHNLGELALVVRRRSHGCDPAAMPLGKFLIPGDESDDAAYLETRVRGSVTNGDARPRLQGELLLRGTTVPSGPLDKAGALAQMLLRPDSHGYVDSRIRCIVDDTAAGLFRCEHDDELIHHGGVTIGAGELDRIYADYPGFLDAAAFAIEDAVMGERIFAAIVPRPEAAPSLADLKRFLAEKGFASYKAPDQLVIVNAIPRDTTGRVLRHRILDQI